LVNDQRDAQFFTMYLFLFLFLTLYMFRAHRPHRQERQIVLTQLLVTSLCVGGRVVCRSEVVSSTSCPSSGETNFVNIISGNCHPVSVAVSCAGRKWFRAHHAHHQERQIVSTQPLVTVGGRVVCR
jgi:hypothetical protein